MKFENLKLSLNFKKFEDLIILLTFLNLKKDFGEKRASRLINDFKNDWDSYDDVEDRIRIDFQWLRKNINNTEVSIIDEIERTAFYIYHHLKDIRLKYEGI